MEWKSVAGRFAGCPYQVSDCGQVKSLCKGRRHGNMLAGFTDKNGYLRVNLFINSEQFRQTPIHTLVAEAFLGLRPDGYTVNHKSGDKTDNRVENLEWLTTQENTAHSVRTGLSPRGVKNRKAIVNDDQVREIRLRKASGEPTSRLAVAFGIRPVTVAAIVSRRSWKHVG